MARVCYLLLWRRCLHNVSVPSMLLIAGWWPGVLDGFDALEIDCISSGRLRYLSACLALDCACKSQYGACGARLLEDSRQRSLISHRSLQCNTTADVCLSCSMSAGPDS